MSILPQQIAKESIMNSNELSEFQYVVKDDIWNVVLKWINEKAKLYKTGDKKSLQRVLAE